jgi:DNA-binding GntR family transcriptional regulator
LEDTQVHRTLASALVEKLREDIMSGDLVPGEKLRASALSRRYQVGVIPLREALSRLVATGFVVAEDQRGFWVAPISRDDLIDLNEARKSIESIALTRSVERGDIQWETDLVAAHHRLARLTPVRQGVPGRIDNDWELAHRAFHRALVAGCSSRTLTEIASALDLQIARYRLLWARGQVDPERDLHAEHQALLRAALDRNEPLCVSLLAGHYDRTVEHLLKASSRLQEG